MSTHDSTSAPVTLGMFSFRTPDPHRLARFWSELVGLPAADGATDDLVMLDLDHEVGPQTWLFERTDEAAASDRLGLDLSPHDDEAWRTLAYRAERLGGSRVCDNDQGGVQWVDMHDPEGNRFRVFPPRRPG
jgi:catechol 2,3-dioxygenase-like lactoylglutathione lyase family enzyme